VDHGSECKHVWAQISDYIEGDVGPELREAIEEHLAHCATAPPCWIDAEFILISSRRSHFEIPVATAIELHARLQDEIAGGE